MEVVRFLVEEGKADVDKATTGGFTPLFMAANNNNTEVARYLLSKGADRTIETTNPSGYTALSIAEEQGHAAMVELLS